MSCDTKFSDANGDREIFSFPVQLITKQDLQPYTVGPYSAISDDRTYYITVCSLYKVVIVHNDLEPWYNTIRGGIVLVAPSDVLVFNLRLREILS